MLHCALLSNVGIVAISAKSADATRLHVKGLKFKPASRALKVIVKVHRTTLPQTPNPKLRTPKLATLLSKGSEGGMKVGRIFPSKSPCIRDP